VICVPPKCCTHKPSLWAVCRHWSEKRTRGAGQTRSSRALVSRSALPLLQKFRVGSYPWTERIFLPADGLGTPCSNVRAVFWRLQHWPSSDQLFPAYVCCDSSLDLVRKVASHRYQVQVKQEGI